MLAMYRSGDFEKIAPHEGKLAAMGVPTLLLWGEDDPFAPIAGAHRLQREIPHAELVVLDGDRALRAGGRAGAGGAELARFLRGVAD